MEFKNQPDFSKTDSGKLGEIKAIFSDIYAQNEFGDLAAEINR